jgi:hypothetical protein
MLRIRDQNWNQRDLKWRVTILKGSYMNWPSLVGATVALNN